MWYVWLTGRYCLFLYYVRLLSVSCRSHCLSSSLVRLLSSNTGFQTDADGIYKIPFQWLVHGRIQYFVGDSERGSASLYNGGLGLLWGRDRGGGQSHLKLTTFRQSKDKLFNDNVGPIFIPLCAINDNVMKFRKLVNQLQEKPTILLTHWSPGNFLCSNAMP